MDYKVADYDDDVYDDLDGNDLKLSERQTLDSFKNVRSVWNVIFLLAYISLSIWCLVHICTNWKKFKSGFPSLLSFTIVLKLYVVFFRDVFLIYNFKGLHQGFSEYIAHVYYFNVFMNICIVMAFATAETLRINRALGCQNKCHNIWVAWLAFFLVGWAIFGFLFLLEFDVLDIGYDFDTALNLAVWTFPVWLVLLGYILFRSRSLTNEWNYWEMSFTKIVVLFMILQEIIVMMGVIDYFVAYETQSVLVSEYSNMVHYIFTDVIDILMLVFYLIIFRTKTSKILPCYNSNIDADGYSLGSAQDR